MKEFISGIVAGIIISFIVAFLLNPTITVSSESQKEINLNQAIPHYEFSKDTTEYVETLSLMYKIKPPFIVFPFNSKQEIRKPGGYVSLDMPRADDCVTYYDFGGKIEIYALSSQFKVSECSTKFVYARTIDKSELATIFLNASWRRDTELGRSYDEEGISIHNKFDVSINNYIFVYSQNESSQIKKRFKDCTEINVFLDGKKVEYRHNFFENSSILAVKFDLSPLQTREVIIRCYQ